MSGRVSRMQRKSQCFSVGKPLRVFKSQVAIILKTDVTYLCFTVKSFVGLSKYLLSLPGLSGKYLLSEHFSQDPVENYFGQLRSAGGWCQNPTLQSCIYSSQSLRVQGSMSMLPVRGNSTTCD